MIDANDHDTSRNPDGVLGDRFELLAAAGTGGMGWVYKAFDRRSHQVVAIKLLFPHLIQNPENLARFRNEVLIARRLSHPHIVRTHTFDELDGHYALTMEFVEGVSLAHHVESLPGPVEESEAVRILLELSAALAYAHGHGVVHCDLKPANILITVEGTAKIADFGISQLSHLALHRAGGNMMVGTPLYMAPEQFSGSKVDFRTDLYSLGVLAFELLSGSPPFAGDSYFALADRHQNMPAPSIRSVRPDVSAGLAAIVDSLLAKNPSDRPASADLLFEQLRCLESAASLAVPMKVIIPAATHEIMEPVEPIKPVSETLRTTAFWGRRSKKGKYVLAITFAFLSVGLFLFAARTNHSTRMRIGAVVYWLESKLDTRFERTRKFLGYDKVNAHSAAEMFNLLDAEIIGKIRYHETVWSIVKGGLPLNVYNERGDTFIHCIAAHNLWYAERHLKLFLSAGLSIDVQNRLTGDSALHQAIRAEKVNTLKLLFTFQPNLNLQNYLGDTPLHVAARSSFLQGLSALRRHGADVNIQNANSDTPLHLLVREGSVMGVREILLSNPNLSLQDRDGRTVLDLAKDLAVTDQSEKRSYGAIVDILEHHISAPRKRNPE